MAGVSLAEQHDVLLLDLDGTVYRGAEPIEPAVAAIAAMKAHIRYVTNNASKAPEQVAESLRGIGVPADSGEIATSAQAGAQLLADKVPAGADVLVIGTESLAAEVDARGLRVNRTVSDGIAGVVQGHSPTTSWADLAEACLAIRAGAMWVACNVDPTLPMERGQLPGNGSMVAALRTATRAEPLVAGKPEPMLFTTAAQGHERPLVVGDRLDTDIAGACNAGMASVLVLSGVTTAAELLEAPAGMRPGHVAADLSGVHLTSADTAIGQAGGWQIDEREGRLRVAGTGTPLELLRSLCEPAWRTGTSAVEATDGHADEALRALGLAADPLPLTTWKT